MAARDNIIQACSLTENRKEQTKLLDLLEIFRVFTEKGQLLKASEIITSQIANLEQATKKIENKTRDLKTIPNAPQSIKPAVPRTVTHANRSKPMSFANVLAGSTSSNNSTLQEWTLVGVVKI